MKRKDKKISKKMKYMILITILICLLSSGYAIFNTKISIGGKINIASNSSCNVDITSKLSTSWKANDTIVYLYNLKVINNYSESIEGWNLKINVPEDATVTASTAIPVVSNGVLILKNESYNTIIYPSSYVEIEIQITTSSSDYEIGQILIDYCSKFEPENLDSDLNADNDSNEDVSEDTFNQEDNLNDTFDKTESEQNIIESNISTLSVTPKIINGWETYNYQYDIEIKNTNENTINSWQFQLVLPEGTTLTQSWNNNYSESNGVITFENISWNGTIEPNNSVVIGIVLNTNIQNYMPTFTNIIGN